MIDEEIQLVGTTGTRYALTIIILSILCPWSVKHISLWCFHIQNSGQLVYIDYLLLSWSNSKRCMPYILDVVFELYAAV